MHNHGIKMIKYCPKCGCPITNENETVCPECGYHLTTEKSHSSLHTLRERIKRIYYKYFYTEEPDPYVDLAAKLCSIPKVLIAVYFVFYIVCILLMLIFYYLAGVFLSSLGGLFPMSIFNLAAGGSIAVLLLYIILVFGAYYLFWQWVANIIVNGVRKIRQSKNK